MIKRDPNCTDCKLHATAQHVCLLGAGAQPSRVMIVGEAPGKREDDSGIPFVGTSGKLLDELLGEQRFTRKNVFITNAVSCRPPDNRTPTKGEIRACNHWLQYQIKQVKPRFILLLGNVALQSVTGKSGIKSKRGRPFEKDGIIYLPTFHPAATFHDPSAEELIVKDLKLFREIVDSGEIPREKNLNIKIVRDIAQFKEMKRDIRASSTVSIDLETASDDPILGGLYPWAKGARIVSFGAGTKTTQWILPVTHPESPWTREVLETMIAELMAILEDCIVVAHNGKFDLLWIWVHFDIQGHLDFDTMLAHYMLDENSLHDLKLLARKFCGAPDWDIDKKGAIDLFGLDVLALYQAHDLYYTRELRFIFGKMLRKEGDTKRIFDEIMMPCSRLFLEVEYDGVCVDVKKMGDAEKYLREEVDKAEKRMRRWGDINWGSPKQLGKLLFGSKREGGLGIAVVEKTKKGANSTSESVIKRIDHPIAGDILKFRGAKQQLSFFIEGWKPYLVKKGNNWFIHPSFKLHGTVTGRLSCEHPNLQQVPRDPRIRSLIIAPVGWEQVEADLSQIELRIAAELAQERTMMDAFRRKIDVHWLTVIRELERGGGGKHVETILRTAKAYLSKKGKPNPKLRFAEAIQLCLEMGPSMAEELQKVWKENDPELVWKEIRKKAKAINFGYLYGMWWKKFKIYARDNYDIIVTDEEAQASRKGFFELYPDFVPWHTRQKRFARMNGYVKSLSQRKRRLPDAQDDDDTPFRREAERQSVNSPVQSFANEINLMSALQLRREFGRDIVRIVGTVHDSILLWVKKTHVARVTSRLLEIMSWPDLFETFDIKFGVPIEAEAKVGPWGASTEFHKWQISSKLVRAR